MSEQSPPEASPPTDWDKELLPHQ